MSLLKLIFFSLLLGLTLTGYAWGDENMTISSAATPMFNTANVHTNTYSNPAYNFSILPPTGWISVGQGNKSDTALAVFANENPEREANFAIYYYQGKPISEAVLATPDSQILKVAIAKLFDDSKYAVYQDNIQRFSDGFAIQAVAAENKTNTPVIEEFSFWLNDGRQYFLVLASSQNGFYQNAAEFERSVYTFYAGPPPTETKIPPWVKNNAKWWSAGTIDDQNFLSGIQYLIKQRIIVIPTVNNTGPTQQQVPLWIKNSAGWWASGQISDSEFVKGIQYLISNGIIKV